MTDALAPGGDADPQQVVDDAPAALVPQVRALLRRALALDVPDADADLVDGGLLDSLAFVEMLFELERTFDIVLDVGQIDIESFRTINRIAAFVARQQDGSAS